MKYLIFLVLLIIYNCDLSFLPDEYELVLDIPYEININDTVTLKAQLVGINSRNILNVNDTLLTWSWEKPLDSLSSINDSLALSGYPLDPIDALSFARKAKIIGTHNLIAVNTGVINVIAHIKSTDSHVIIGNTTTKQRVIITEGFILPVLNQNITITGNNQVTVNNQIYLTVIANNVENANSRKFIWVSSNPSIATVNANGTVQGISIGNAVIKATTLDEDLFFNSFTITVIE